MAPGASTERMLRRAGGGERGSVPGVEWPSAHKRLRSRTTARRRRLFFTQPPRRRRTARHPPRLVARVEDGAGPSPIASFSKPHTHRSHMLRPACSAHTSVWVARNPLPPLGACNDPSLMRRLDDLTACRSVCAQDLSDYQWREFRERLPLLCAVACAHLSLSWLVRLRFPTRPAPVSCLALNDSPRHPLFGSLRSSSERPLAPLSTTATPSPPLEKPGAPDACGSA